MIPLEDRENLIINEAVIAQVDLALEHIKTALASTIDVQNLLLVQTTLLYENYHKDIASDSELTVHAHNFFHESQCIVAAGVLDNLERITNQLQELIASHREVLITAARTTTVHNPPHSDPLPVISFGSTSSSDSSDDGSSATSSSSSD